MSVARPLAPSFALSHLRFFCLLVPQTLATTALVIYCYLAKPDMLWIGWMMMLIFVGILIPFQIYLHILHLEKARLHQQARLIMSMRTSSMWRWRQRDELPVYEWTEPPPDYMSDYVLEHVVPLEPERVFHT